MSQSSSGPQRRAADYAVGLDKLLCAGCYPEAVRYMDEAPERSLEALAALLVVSLARSGSYPTCVRGARERILERLLALPELAGAENRLERLRSRYINQPVG